MPKPLVAVVGRPNVGKSTLFNRLAGRRIAIVERTPGVTRDRLYSTFRWRGREFTVVDTGGIVLDEKDPLSVQVRRQAEIAMEEADAILFVCDAGEGLTATDLDLADLLRAARVPVFLVVNKADSPGYVQETADFYRLGLGEVYAISAVHGHGLADLLDRLAEALPNAGGPDEDEDAVRLAVIGRPNVGKSSLTNAILGEDRVIVSPVPGTTRDAIDTPLEWDGTRILLIDTAGIRRTGKVQGSVEYYTLLRTRSAVERCHVAAVVIDAAAGLTDGDKRAAGLAHEHGRACVLVMNKWDLVDPSVAAGRPPSRDLMLHRTEELRREMPFLAYAPVVFASAVRRLSIREVVETALSAAQNHAHRIPTGELNRIIRDAIEEHPYTAHGRPLKIYYATMPRVQPPTVLLFVNDPDLLHFSYVRYLENRIRGVYPLEGTPILIHARKAQNVERSAA
jgi:GTP-binding protein